MRKKTVLTWYVDDETKDFLCFLWKFLSRNIYNMIITAVIIHVIYTTRFFYNNLI